MYISLYLDRIVNLNDVVGDRVDGPRRAVAGDQPGERVRAAAYLCHEGHLGLPGPEWALLLGLLHEGLVAEDGLALVAPDGDDEHAEEDALHHQDDRVQDAGLHVRAQRDSINYTQLRQMACPRLRDSQLRPVTTPTNLTTLYLHLSIKSL